MNDLAAIAVWMATQEKDHADLNRSTLPDPTCMYEGRELVSFSSNNYLGLATSERMKAKAHAAIDRYGVGNCESRLLGGNLEIYDRLDARLAEIKRKDSSLLFTTGYLTNLGVPPPLVSYVTLSRAFLYT